MLIILPKSQSSLKLLRNSCWPPIPVPINQYFIDFRQNMAMLFNLSQSELNLEEKVLRQFNSENITEYLLFAIHCTW